MNHCHNTETFYAAPTLPAFDVDTAVFCLVTAISLVVMLGL
ncbi:MAG TPA: hypothetical protein VGK09_10260 [Rhodocyclaceae bacterium]|jgi:hypothetical protein